MHAEINKSNISSLSWAGNTLTITYSSGQVTDYMDVPEGIAAGAVHATSTGAYLNRYVAGVFKYRVTAESRDKEKMRELIHYKEHTTGLWVTDIESAIPADKKHLFWQL